MIDARTLRRFWVSVRSGLRGVTGAPLVFALSVTTMAAGLLMLSAYLLVVQNVRSVVSRYGEDLSLVAFLAPGRKLEPQTVAALEKTLAGLENVERVDFVPPARALERLRADLGDDAEILDNLVSNPLPASYEIRLREGARTPDHIQALASRVRRVDGVDDVRYGEAWVEGYSRVLRALEWIGAGLGACLVLVLGVIVAGTVRLAVHARADEIQIQRLVGAGGLFVRLPFFLEAALQGFLGAGIALSLLYGLFRLGLPVVGEPLQLLLGLASPSFFGPLEVSALLLVGASLGVGAAMVSLLRLDETP